MLRTFLECMNNTIKEKLDEEFSKEPIANRTFDKYIERARQLESLQLKRKPRKQSIYVMENRNDELVKIFKSQSGDNQRNNGRNREYKPFMRQYRCEHLVEIKTDQIFKKKQEITEIIYQRETLIEITIDTEKIVHIQTIVLTWIKVLIEKIINAEEITRTEEIMNSDEMIDPEPIMDLIVKGTITDKI